jgi:hypothetical protein
MALPLPPEIEAQIALAEKLVDDDINKMQDTLDELDAVPVEAFDDPSVVRAVDNLRRQVRTTERVARASAPPPMRSRAGVRR